MSVLLPPLLRFVAIVSGSPLVFRFYITADLAFFWMLLANITIHFDAKIMQKNGKPSLYLISII
jgi:hypothetical protein